MNLLGLPFEILAQILYEAILVRKLRRAMRLRLVNRQFAQHANTAIFRSQILNFISLLYGMGPETGYYNASWIPFVQAYAAYQVLKNEGRAPGQLIVMAAKWISAVTGEGQDNLYDCVKHLCGAMFMGDWRRLRELLRGLRVRDTSEYEFRIQGMIHLGCAPQIRRLLTESSTSEQNSKFWRDLSLEKRLEIAAYRGHIEVVKLLIDLDPTFQKTGKISLLLVRTILRHAALGGHKEMFDLALDLSDRDDDEGSDWKGFYTELAQASRTVAYPENYKRIIEILGPEHSVFSLEFNGDVLPRIETSAYWGRVKMVRYFLGQGVCLNDPAARQLVHSDDLDRLKSRNVYRPLISAIENGNPEIVKLMLEHGADPNWFPSQHTALMTGVMKGNPEIVRLLVEHGADVNNGVPPPIVLALSKEDMEMVQYLRSNGAILDTPETGDLAMRYADIFGLDSVRDWLAQEGVKEGDVSDQIPSKYEVERYPLLFNGHDRVQLETVTGFSLKNRVKIRQKEIGEIVLTSCDF